MKKEKLGIHGLTLKEERFCYFYVKNEETRGNKTHSYALAYGIDLDKLSDEKPIDTEGEIIGRSPRAKAENCCASAAVQLLRKLKISDYCTKLWNNTLKDEIVDGELAKIILQDDKLEAKIAGIREYNRLRKRTTEISGAKRPLEDMTDEELAATQKEARKLLTKQ